MNTEQRRQSKRIQGIEASLVSEIGERNRKPNEVGARLKVPTKDYADVETQEFQAIDHSDPNHGAESLNPIRSADRKTNPSCKYRELLRQQKPRDSGFAEQSVVDIDDPYEEAEGEIDEATGGPESAGEERGGEDRENLGSENWRSLPDPSGESSIVDKAEESESEESESEYEALLNPRRPQAATPVAMAQRPPPPQLKYQAHPIFYGRHDEDAVDWLERYESTALYNRWGAEEKRENFGMHLDGTARKLFLCAGAPTVWEDIPAVVAAPGIAAVPVVVGLRTKFLREFQPQHYSRYQEAKLRQRKQAINETGIEYFYDIIDLCRRVDPRMSEEAKIDYLFRGLKPTLVEKIWVTSPTTTAEFLAALKLHKEATELANRPDWAVSVLGPERDKLPMRPEQKEDLRLRDLVLELKAETADMKRASRPPIPWVGKEKPRPSITTDGRPICHTCGRAGKIARYCEARRRSENGRQAVSWRNQPRNATGEGGRDERRNDRVEERGNRQPTVGMVSTDEDDVNESTILLIDSSRLITEDVICQGVRVSAVIDTIAVVSVASPSLQEKLQIRQTRWDGPSVLMVNGQKIPPLGALELDIEHRGMKAKGKVILLEMNGIELLLGNDFLSQFKRFQINYDDKEAELLLGELPVNAITDQVTNSSYKLVTKTGRLLPPRAIVPVEIEPTTLEEGTWMIEPSENLVRAKGITTGKVLVPTTHPLGHLLMVNLTNRQTYLREGTVLGQIEALDSSIVTVNEGEPRIQREEVAAENTEVSAVSEEVPAPASSREICRLPRQAIHAQIAEGLSHLDTENLVDLLQEFSSCFAQKDSELGICKVAEHQINTGLASPVHQTPYKSAWKERTIVQQQVDEMLEKGVVEPSNSPWASPVVLVKKKDGSWRFCVDYRRLNTISVKDVYPLPRIEETLSRMDNACIFSAMDLESGYWQVPMHNDAKAKTAFVTPGGLYQFLVMPFGLASAPGTFQRMMNLVLAGLRWTICLVYLDDIIVYAAGVDEHLKRVRQVLTALQDAGLKIKLVKCKFGAREV